MRQRPNACLKGLRHGFGVAGVREGLLRVIMIDCYKRCQFWPIHKDATVGQTGLSGEQRL